jgi:hypothetical protein
MTSQELEDSLRQLVLTARRRRLTLSEVRRILAKQLADLLGGERDDR